MAKKKLLIYAHYYIPDTASTGQILRELAEGMLDKFDITVICVVPSYLGTIEDIFPIDFCDSADRMKGKIKKYLFWNKVLLMKCKYKVWNATNAKNGKWKYLPFTALSRFMSKKFIVEKIESIINDWNINYAQTGLCYESCGYNFLNWIMKKDYVRDITQIYFEDDLFSAPIDFQKYLTDVYLLTLQ